MTYQRITTSKKCVHKISLRRNCIQCIEFFISEKQTEIKLLREKIIITKRQEAKLEKRK